MVPGGVVAVDRHYFQNTGAYDPLLSLQGGGNLELSLKVCPGPWEALEVLWSHGQGHSLEVKDAASDKHRVIIRGVSHPAFSPSVLSLDIITISLLNPLVEPAHRKEHVFSHLRLTQNFLDVLQGQHP